MRLSDLPLLDATWSGARRPFLSDDEHQVAWVDDATGQIRGFLLVPPDAGPEVFWQALVQAMEAPQQGEPGRPARVAVDDPAALSVLQAELSGLGVAVEHQEESVVGEALGLARSRVTQAAGYLGREDADPAVVGDLFAAAARWWRLEPWRALEDTDLLRVEGLAESPLLLSVMGSNGEEQGLALFQSQARMDAFLYGPSAEALEHVRLFLTFATAEAAGGVVVGEIAEHGWPVADPEALPVAANPTDPEPFASPADLRLLISALGAVEAWMDAGGPREPVVLGGLRVAYERVDGGPEDPARQEALRQVMREADLEALRREGVEGPALEACRLAALAETVTDDAARARLVEEALAQDPSCLAALLLQALEADDEPEAAVARLQALVQQGRDALAEAPAWSVRSARPWLRASRALMEALSAAGRRDEALQIARDLLALDEDDALDLRFFLMQHLLEAGRLEEAEGLYGQFGHDASAPWRYTGALVEFLVAGDSPEARDRLFQALEANPHVLERLLDVDRLDSSPPEFVAPGEVDEAQRYASTFWPAWYRDEGKALQWAATTIRTGRTLTRAPRPGRNEPCWCGSGRKYKKCHLEQDRREDSLGVPRWP